VLECRRVCQAHALSASAVATLCCSSPLWVNCQEKTVNTLIGWLQLLMMLLLLLLLNVAIDLLQACASTHRNPSQQ
jgi:hypothetical protein